MAAPPILPPVALTVPDGFKLLIALLIMGAAVEMLYKVSPGASTMFVALILLGYAASGGNLQNVVAWFQTVGAIAR